MRRKNLCFTMLLSTLCATVSAQTHAAGNLLDGKWAGAFDIIRADGSVDQDLAYFAFREVDGKVTGTAGSKPGEQSAILSGSVHGAALIFDVVVNPQVTAHFNLQIDGVHLHGSATGVPVGPGERVIVDAVRANEQWVPSSAITHATDQLFLTVQALDKKLFDAYNTCDLKTLGSLVSDDLEFYHDKTGLAIGKTSFVDSIGKNICSKVHRELVPGTLEVHTLKGFGAVEMGIHRFTHPGKPEDGLGEAKFITLWQHRPEGWVMTRAISYDHAPVKN